MKKKRLFLMIGLIAAMLANGCGKRENDSSKEGTEPETPTVTEEAAEQETETPKVTEEVKDPSQAEEIEIEIPGNSELLADYTTASEIELPGKTRIAVVVKETKSPYWQAIKEGMEKAIADLNEEAGLEGENMITMTFEGAADGGDAEGQINIVDAVLAENPAAICLSAIDMNSLMAQLEMAEENQIPVVIFDSGINTGEFDSLISSDCKTDNYNAGKEAARHLASELKEKGKILVAGSQQKTESISERIRGFTEEIEEKYPDISIVETIYGDDEEADETAIRRMEQVLEKDSEINGCFAADEGMAVDILQSIDRLADESFKFVGFDAGEEQIQAIRDGVELGTICQNPYGMGYASIIASARAVMGLENEKEIDAGFQWIDSTNIDLEENKKYLYR